MRRACVGESGPCVVVDGGVEGVSGNGGWVADGIEVGVSMEGEEGLGEVVEGEEEGERDVGVVGEAGEVMGEWVGEVGIMIPRGRGKWEGKRLGDLGGDWSLLSGKGREVMGDLDSMAGRGTRCMEDGRREKFERVWVGLNMGMPSRRASSISSAFGDTSKIPI